MHRPIRGTFKLRLLHRELLPVQGSYSRELLPVQQAGSYSRATDRELLPIRGRARLA